ALQLSPSQNAHQDQVRGDEERRDAPGASRIHSAPLPGKEDRAGTYPAELVDEDVVDAPEQAQSDADGMERIGDVVVREFSIAKEMSRRPEQQEQPGGEHGERREIQGSKSPAFAIAGEHRKEDQGKKDPRFLCQNQSRACKRRGNVAVLEE